MFVLSEFDHEYIESAYDGVAKALKALVEAKIMLEGAQFARDAAEANHVALGLKGSNAAERKADLDRKLMHHTAYIGVYSKQVAKAQLDYDLARIPVSKIKLHLQLQSQMIAVEELQIGVTQ